MDGWRGEMRGQFKHWVYVLTCMWTLSGAQFYAVQPISIELHFGSPLMGVHSSYRHFSFL